MREPPRANPVRTWPEATGTVIRPGIIKRQVFKDRERQTGVNRNNTRQTPPPSDFVEHAVHGDDLSYSHWKVIGDAAIEAVTSVKIGGTVVLSRVSRNLPVADRAGVPAS